VNRTLRADVDVDVVVVGSGVAGLSVALRLAGTRSVALVTGAALGGGSSRLAQGGLAVAADPDDHPASHAADTVTVGAGLCSPSAVGRLAEEGPLRVAELLAAGAVLDRDVQGRLELGREGGHSRRRIVHAGGDATGAEVTRALTAAVRSSPVQVIEHASVEEVLLAPGRSGRVAAGVRVRRGNSVSDISARAVVLATGGVGGLFANSTNPAEVTGEGWGLALRAGAMLTDVEFVQFHPTALRAAATGHRLPLVTEALRGEGAVLVDGRGRPVMNGQHPLADLAPRDVVARRLSDVMGSGDGPDADVYLDATALGDRRLREHFPTVRDACLRIGVDPAAEPIPVTPAQHFACGGVRTDRWGESSLPGLFAVGEVAATGAHGANRLASNSLVEALVFGARVAARLTLDLPDGRRGAVVDSPPAPVLPAGAAAAIVAATTTAAAIVRSESGLAAGEQTLRSLAAAPSSCTGDVGVGNRWLSAVAMIVAARARTESRGCHWRTDFPGPSTSWLRHLSVRLDPSGTPTVGEDWQERCSA
jgi:L-aspartate oxidase